MHGVPSKCQPLSVDSGDTVMNKRYPILMEFSWIDGNTKVWGGINKYNNKMESKLENREW